MKLSEKNMRQIKALKSIGYDSNDIAKRYGISACNLKKQYKNHIRKMNHIRVSQWKASKYEIIH